MAELSRRSDRPVQRRTVFVVILSLLLGLVGATGLTTDPRPATAAVSVTQVGNWKFDAGTGTTAADSVGTKPATLGAGATWTPGIRGTSALAVNGTSTGTATTSGPVLTTNSSFSVSTYVKLNTLTGFQTLVSQDGVTNSAFYLQLRESGRFGFSTVSADVAGPATTFAGALAAPVVGQWYHLAGVYNSVAGTLTLYVNGRLQSTVTTTANFATTGNFAMGRAKYGGNPVDFLNGTLDDVRAYSGALTAADVEQIADSVYYKLDEGTGTAAADAGLNGFNGTLVNGPLWTPGVIGPAAVNFDGVNDFVDANSAVLDTSKSFSVTAWARVDASGSETIASVDGVNVSAFQLQLRSDGKWGFIRQASDSTTAATTASVSTAAVILNSWYHLTGVYDSVAGTISLYVNGVLQTSVPYTTGWRGTGDFVVGRGQSSGAANHFDGAIDEVHAYPFVLEAGAITALAAPTAPPAPATPTASASGTTVTLNWVAPAPIAGSPTTGYVVTPYVNGVAGTPQTFNTTATTQTFTGLTVGSSYRYTVAAINANGTSLPSGQSAAVTAAAVPSAPAAPTASARSLSASVSWTAPASNGSAITGYVVTPYIGTTAGTAQTYNSTATTQTVTGLTAGTSYTFRVAAINAVGTGVQSVASNAVIPNTNPVIAVVTPTPGRVGVAYSFTFTRSGGTSPFTWSVSAGTLPGGLTLAVATGVLSGTPTTAGSYAFTARVTDVGGVTDTEPVTLVISDRPSTPAAPTASAGVASATVSWAAPASNGSAITGYVVTPYLNGTAQTAETFASTATSQTLTGLTAGGSYTFTVAATNANGTSAASAQSTAVTPYAAPSAPAAPTGTAGAQSVTLNWVAPATNGSAITGYRVTPFIGTTAQTPVTFTSSATTQTISGLSAGTAYTFTVAAQNAAGFGPASAASAPITPAASVPATPAPPTATAGASSATITWVAPANNGSALTGYVVTPYLNGVAQTAVSFDATTITRTISGLTVAGSYTFSVKAVNAAGTSSESGVSNTVFPYDVPGAPTITAATAGTQRATLTWTAPNSNGSAVTAYVVTPYIGTTAQAPQTFASAALTQTVTGLTAGTAYTFRVAATNAAGTGPQSAASTSVTPNAAPTLTFGDPPTARLGVAYSNQFAVTGGTSPYTWSISVGTLPAGLALSSTGLLSGTPTAVSRAGVTVRVVDASGQVAIKAITVTVADRPATPAQPTATAGLTSAVLSWTAPAANNSTITAYVITPYRDGTAQTAITVDPSAKTRTLTGLTAGSVYTFTIAATNAVGSSAASATSNAVTPYAALSEPAITSLTAGSTSARLTWTAPTSNGGSAITGYVVTPYIDGVAQTPQAFNSTATTQTVTGLTAGTAYTFKVAATNNSGSNPLYRINAGGPLVPAIDGGPDWVADDSASSTLRNTGSSASVFAGSVSFDATVPSTTPVGIFNTERWDAGFSGDGGEMSWAIPVDSGARVQVRLYFANRFAGTNSTGSRVFDVRLDGASVLPGFDIVAAAKGTDIATMREFAITSDGTVNLDFTHSVENPLINGIEIIQTGVATTGPQSAASAAATPNAAPAITIDSVPNGQVSVGYTKTFAVSGGTAPFTWSVSSGALPAGLTLNASTGVLSGTPTTAGSSTFTVRVMDATNSSATRDVTLVIVAAPTVAFTPAAGEVGVAYSQQATVSGGTGPYTWSLAAGSLPAGVTLNASTGVVSGTPTASGSFSVTLRVTDANGQVASKTATLTIAAAPTLNSTPPGGRAGVGYSFTFAASGGTGPFTYSVVAGSLPAGITLSSAGVLSGTSQLMGTWNFTVRAVDSFNQSATKAATLTLEEPPIRVVKSANVTSVAPGGSVTYTVTATNISTTGYANTHLYDPLADVLDDATYSGDATVSSGSVAYAGGTLDWTIPLAAGASATLTYTVVVANPGTGNKVLSGLMTSSFASTSCNPGYQASSCNATVTVSGLSIAKTASVATTTPGSTVAFTILVTNTGQTPFTGATFSDNLGGAGVLDDATYVDGSATSGALAYSGSTLTWTGSLAVGASATITYSVIVNNPDNGNRSLSSTIVSSTAASTCPGANPAPSCTATVTVLVPGLSIQNTAGSSTAIPGDTVTSAVTVTNTGQTAYSGISVNVALAGALDDTTLDNYSATAGTVTLNTAAGTLTWSGDLALGASITINTSGTVRNPDPGNRWVTTVASSSAAGSTCPPGSTNAACTSNIQVLVPALTLTKSADVSTTTPGSVVGYTIVVTNTGQTAYTAAAFTDALGGVLDDAVYNNNATATAGTVSVSSTAVTWSGDLAVGASATVNYSVRVRDPNPGDQSLTGRVTSTTPFNNCAASSIDSRCTSTVAVLTPGLRLSTVASVATTTPGGVVRYTVTATNTGQTTHSGVTVNVNSADVTDDATSNFDGQTSSGTVVPNSAQSTLAWTLTLAPGETATTTVSYTVRNPDPGNRVLISTVSSSAPGSSCPTSAASPSCVATTTVLIPGLSITKTASAQNVTPGDTVSYTVTVVNTGETSFPAASFTDDLATVLTDSTYVAGSATASIGTASVSGSVLSWTGTLAPGASATVTYSVTVLDPDPGDKRMINTVVSDTAGSNCAAESTDPACTATVDVLVPQLTIAKTADRATTVPGQTVTYTVTVTNSGATPYTGATVTDSLAGVLDDATFDGNASATSGGVSYSAPTLTWTGNLAVGAAATFSYAVIVRAADVGNDLLVSSLTSTARGNNCASGSTDTRCTVTVPVARLVLQQLAAETSATPGSVVHLTGTWTNTGQVPYVGISVVSPRADTSDDTIPTGDQTASSGTFVRTSTAITWAGDIPVGGVVTTTRTLVVRNPDPGNKIITATLTSDAPGTNCPTAGGSDPRCTFSVPVLVPGLTITKVADRSAAAPGEVVGYTITAQNTGQTAYTGATLSDPLTAVLDDAAYDANATATSGTVSYSASTVSWTGNLAVGATVIISYSVTTAAQGTGDKSMGNTVSSDATGSNCPTGSTNTACRSTVIALTPALTIVKAADVEYATLGSTVSYSINVTNSGQVFSSASFSDSLTDVLDDADIVPAGITATSGTVSYANETVTWSGGLAPGASATITYRVAIDLVPTGDQTMTNVVSSATNGNNCPAGSSDSRCTVEMAVTDSVALIVTQSANRRTAVSGDQIDYTVTLANTSQTAVSTAGFTQELSDVLDDATFDVGSEQASSGAVVFDDPNLTWTGSVPAGETVTVTYSVTVRTALPGNEILTSTVVATSPGVVNDCPPGSTDPRCTKRIAVAALDIHELSPYTTARPGETLSMSVRFENTGQVPYEGIVISAPGADLLDDAVPVGDQTARDGNSQPTGSFTIADAIEWHGDIPVGGVVTISAHIVVRDPATGNKQLVSTWETEAPGSNCAVGSTDPQCATMIEIQEPELTITKTADTATAVPGEVVGYTITVQNTGESAYLGAVVTDDLSGVLDDAGFDEADVTVSSGTANYADPVLTWTGDLAVNATATITYRATVLQAGSGDQVMVNGAQSEVQGATCSTTARGDACLSSVSVLTPALTLTSTSNVASTVPGAPVTYTVTATNTGQTSYSPATFSVALGDVLDDASVTTAPNATAGDVTLTGQTLTWTGTLGVGASASVSYTVTVDTVDTGNQRLTQSVVSNDQGSSCPVGASDPRCVTSVPVASLQILNTADVATTTPTSVVHYQVTFTNTGQVPYDDITVDYNLVGAVDDATYNGDATADAGTLTINAGVSRVSWTGDIAVGQTVTVTSSMTVLNPDPGKKTMTTTAVSAAPGSNCASGSTDPDCTSNVTVLTPRLSITKAADKATATPGSSVTYTITVANTGQTPYTAATVTDSLAAVLDEAAYNSDATATGGTVGYASSTLTWTGDLAVGQSATLTYSVTINNQPTGDRTLINRAVSDEQGSTCPTGGSAPACATTVRIVVPALEVTLTPDTTTTTPGSTVNYTLTVRNTGQTSYLGASATVSLTGVLDDGAYAGGATTTAGTVTFTSPSLTWMGDLAIGATATTSYAISVSAPDLGNHALTSSVASSTAGSTCSDASPCVSTVTVLTPGLAISTSASVATATPGDDVTFTISIANTGETPVANATVTTSLAAVLDDATFGGTATASAGTASVSADTLTWTGSLAVGASATVTYQVTISPPDGGDQTLTSAAVSSAAGSTCPTGNANPACTATVSVLVPSLAITKSASVSSATPGDEIDYIITVTNTGQTSYTGATVTDDLSGLLGEAAYNGGAEVDGSGVLTYADAALTWTGNVAVGATAVISYSVTVNSPATGDRLLTNVVTSAAAGSSCPVGTASPSCVSSIPVLLPELTITKTADRSVVVAGAAVTYTVTVTNTGETAYAPATFSDSLAEVLDDAGYAGGATATTGTVAYADQTLSWSGPLAIGATATITYSVTTHPAAAGDQSMDNSVVSTSAGSSCATATAAGCRVVISVLVPAVSVTKSADATHVVAGDRVGYTIVATNTGQADYPSLALTDSLTDVLSHADYNADATSSSGQVGFAQGVLSWNGTLPVGESVAISYSVTVRGNEPGNAQLVNRVVVDAAGSTCPTDSANASCSTSTVIDEASLSLSGLSSSFELTGVPGSTPESDGAVVGSVITNNRGGYSVTVQASEAYLNGRAVGNSDVIPVNLLSVRGQDTSGYQPLSSTSPVIVHRQSTASSASGDAVSNDYKVQIPFVQSDEYTTSLDYIVTAQ